MRKRIMIAAVAALGAAGVVLAPAAQAQTPAQIAAVSAAAPYSSSQLCQTNDFYNDEGWGVEDSYTYLGRQNEYLGSTLYGVYSWREDVTVFGALTSTRYFTQNCPPY